MSGSLLALSLTLAGSPPTHSSGSSVMPSLSVPTSVPGPGRVSQADDAHWLSWPPLTGSVQSESMIVVRLRT